jgi:hypothetical protein
MTPGPPAYRRLPGLPGREELPAAERDDGADGDCHDEHRDQRDDDDYVGRRTGRPGRLQPEQSICRDGGIGAGK